MGCERRIIKTYSLKSYIGSLDPSVRCPEAIESSRKQNQSVPLPPSSTSTPKAHSSGCLQTLQFQHVSCLKVQVTANLLTKITEQEGFPVAWWEGTKGAGRREPVNSYFWWGRKLEEKREERIKGRKNPAFIPFPQTCCCSCPWVRSCKTEADGTRACLGQIPDSGEKQGGEVIWRVERKIFDPLSI